MDYNTGRRVLEGHKASFCLEDNECTGELEAKYDCESYGDQGITPGQLKVKCTLIPFL